MDIEMVTVRNTLTGAVGTIPKQLLKNTVIVNPEIIMVVEPGAKPYVPELYKPNTVKDVKGRNKKKGESDETDQKDEEQN